MCPRKSVTHRQHEDVIYNLKQGAILFCSERREVYGGGVYLKRNGVGAGRRSKLFRGMM